MNTCFKDYLKRFSYPQKEFVNSILPFIAKNEKKVLLDVPCGNGATSWQFSQLKNLTVYAYDIDADSIQSAIKCFASGNLIFKVGTIKSVVEDKKGYDYFCIINSLFLLSDPEKLLYELKAVLPADKTLFVILPNADGPNFKWFQEKHPTINTLILKKNQFNDYFSAIGWSLKEVIPIVFARTYGRKDIRFYSMLSPFYLRSINRIYTLLKIGTPNYFTLVLKNDGI